MSIVSKVPLSGALAAIVNAFKSKGKTEPASAPSPILVSEPAPETTKCIGKTIKLVEDHFKRHPEEWSSDFNSSGWHLSNNNKGLHFNSLGMTMIRLTRGGAGLDEYLNEDERSVIRNIRKQILDRESKKRWQEHQVSVKSLEQDLLKTPVASKKPVLLIDMDGVVVDYYGGFAEGYKYNHPDREILPPDQIHDFYIENVYGKEVEKDIFAVTRSRNFFLRLKPLPGAVEALKKILADGKFDPYLCTAPDNDSEDLSCHSEKASWVKLFLGDEWLDRLILSKDKTLIQGAYIIDDKPNMKGVNIDNPSWKRIVFNHAYNQSTPGYRLYDWRDWVSLEPTLLAAL